MSRTKRPTWAAVAACVLALLFAAPTWRAILHAAITDNLSAHWACDEASSGTRQDSTANNHDLSDTNTVAAGTAKIGAQSCDIESGSVEYLSVADHADFEAGAGDMTFVAWVNFESDANMAIAAKWGTSTNFEWRILRTAATDLVSFGVSSNGTATAVTETHTTVTATATYYFIAARFDNTNDLIHLRINADDESTAFASNMNTGASPFYVGADNGGSGGVMDGLIDEPAFWKRYLSDAELDTLYNSGTGLAYPWATSGVAGRFSILFADD